MGRQRLYYDICGLCDLTIIEKKMSPVLTIIIMIFLKMMSIMSLI